MQRPDYKIYEGKPKEDRKAIAADTDRLEKKRFVLSGNPEIKKRLSILREAVKELKLEYPEIISFLLFGSCTKGYASPESDIDGYLLVDKDAAMSGRETRDIINEYADKFEEVGEVEPAFLISSRLRPPIASHLRDLLTPGASTYCSELVSEPHVDPMKWGP